MIDIISTSLSPLCILPSGNLVCYKHGVIYVMQNENILFTHIIPIGNKEKFLGRFRYLNRLFRFGIRTAEAIDETHIVLSIGNMIYEMDLTSGNMSNGFFCGEGIRPLIFTKVSGLDSFTDGLYFGGYLGNRSKTPVHIYRRVDVDNWEIVYTFSRGTINHVHSIVSDSYRQCLWIFTGDFDEASAIWKVTENFKKIERVLCNDQKYRACVVFALPEGLLYATDAPFVDDFIYLMNPISFEVKVIAPISGSCIYGCQWNNQFVFSSTVEPDGRHNTVWERYFGRKRGSGIKDNYVHLYCGDIFNGFKEIYKEKKDKLPYIPFQFGVFKFPYGQNNTDTLYFQPIATNENDQSLMRFSK